MICEEVFWTDNLFRQHWKKCVLKWVKSVKNVQENAAVEEQLMSQVIQQEQNYSKPNSLKPTEIISNIVPHSSNVELQKNLSELNQQIQQNEETKGTDIYIRTVSSYNCLMPC